MSSSQFGGIIIFLSVSQRISQLLQNFFFINWIDSTTLWDEFWMDYVICLLMLEVPLKRTKIFIPQLEVKA